MSEPRSQFDDIIEPVPSQSGGVYPLRSREVAGVGSFRTNSAAKRAKQDALEAEADNIEDRDIKTKQVFRGTKLLWLAYQSTGVIYGDIGTSPLYVYSSTFTSDPSYDDLLGALSLIIWSLTIMVSIKYCLIILRADDEGEGGTFALFTLLSRYANIVRRDPREEQRIKMERHRTGDLGKPAQKARNLIERSWAMQWLLKIVGVLGVALVMSDGVLTPAQSVLGAIQGIEVVSPSITNPTIIGVSCAILVALFSIQPLGITKLASTFAPIVIVWLLFNASFGIFNLVKHDASVLKAFSPYFAGAFLMRNRTEGWKSLGGILLAFTGCEALFADLGAFTRRAVQLSWLFFAFPCLLLGYIGQAAYISEHPTAWTNPFYNTVPPGCFWPSLVIAILAAIVASQAMITAVFQLLSQIMKLSYFPQIKAVHTSKIFYGQIYIPAANWLLMIGSVIVTAVYNNTTSLGHAYGVCVILVTFMSTCMVAVVALIVWKVPAIIVGCMWLIFALFDGVFLSSALTKVPEGAWFTLALAVVLSCVFILWRFGKEQQWRAEATDRFPPSHMLCATDSTDVHSRKLRLLPAFGGGEITRIDGVGIFFDKAGSPSTTPTVFIHFLQKFHAASDVIIFFHLRPLAIPTVPPAERYAVTRCYIGSDGNSKAPMPDCYRVVIRHGYNDEVITENLGLLLYEQVRNFIILEGVYVDSDRSTMLNRAKETVLQEKSVDSARPSFEQSEVAEKLAAIQLAYSTQVVYIIGKEQMRITPGTNVVRRALLELFLWVRENTRTKVQALNVAIDKLVEVGFVKEV
ncbi:potassium uptake protein [Capronia coronata CBS 617.96]|uniref:Potassium uptake protein n=1 Tax=Capronia coronata CBS 617.96 TaxID=1182541 RepID=W9YST7_9EURO|nr:potassium uptake protein [Capronia coronata CBS 617.96]EXJ95947.1 potassium uptake protein [Capronia coronata CBS 617.96]